jgi:outer membrane protein
MRAILSLWLSLLCLPSILQGADLLDVYELALANDTRFQAAAHARDAVLESRPLARSALLPQVIGGASYGVQRTEITVQQDVGGELTRSDTSEPHSYGLSLSQVLFDVGAFLQLRQAGDEIAAAEATFAAESQALVFRTAAAYFDVLGAQDTLRFARAENESLGRQRDQADARFEAGIAAYTDVQEAQAQFDLSRAAVLEAERLVVVARQALAVITTHAELPLLALGAEIPLASPQPDEPDAWVAAALESNFDLLATKIETEIAEREVDVLRSAYLPTLRLEGDQRFGRSAGFNRGDFDIRGVFVNLDVPVFTGLARQANVRRSRSTYEQRRAEFEGARRTVESLTWDAFQGVTTGAGQVRALRQAVRSNQTALEATEAGMRVGTRTIVDVLTGQRLLYEAERNYARARYDYLLSVLRLKQVAGRLHGGDLVGINALLAPGPDLPTEPTRSRR